MEELKKFLPKATDLAKKKFFSQNTMNEKEFEEYINKIDHMVKNKKKENKFIDLNLVRNNNNLIELEENDNENENKEENIYEKEENLETTTKKRGRKKTVEKKKNKVKEEVDIKNKEENKEELLTHEETINLSKKSNKDISNNNEIHKLFIKKKSKKEINFINEEVKHKNDDFLLPISINNTNNSNNINGKIMYDSYYKKDSNNKNNNKFNDYKIKKVNESELNRKSTMEEEFQNNDKKTINNLKRCRNNNMRYFDSKEVKYNIEIGKEIYPGPSYGEIDYKESHNCYFKKNSKNLEKIERKNSYKYLNRQSSYCNGEFPNIIPNVIHHNFNELHSLSNRASFL